MEVAQLRLQQDTVKQRRRMSETLDVPTDFRDAVAGFVVCEIVESCPNTTLTAQMTIVQMLVSVKQKLCERCLCQRIETSLHANRVCSYGVDPQNVSFDTLKTLTKTGLK